MEEHLSFTIKNRQRVQTVASTFGRNGRILLKPGRILVGEGCLLKLCRRGPQPKAFFLFDDLLVYGSIMVPGRWNKSLNIVDLEQIHQEDLEDGMAMANQWLIRTPRKSFYVSAASAEEKNAWMGHIEKYRKMRLQSRGLTTDSKFDFATPWIPDVASAICMRCSTRFNVTNRRHHCRRCGYIVCRDCSKNRTVLPNISTRPVRVCQNCMNCIIEGQEQRQKIAKEKHWKKNSIEDTSTQPEYEKSSDEENEPQDGYQLPTKWFKSQKTEDLSPYCYIKPEHRSPPVSGL